MVRKAALVTLEHLLESSLALGHKPKLWRCSNQVRRRQRARGRSRLSSGAKPRAGAGRRAEAVTDFDTVLQSVRSDSVTERALYGRAICRQAMRAD